MALFASLAGIPVVTGSITVPLYGLWSADVQLGTDDDVTDDASLVLGDLTLTGHIYRQSLFGGQRKCRLVGGFGGWRKVVSAKPYSLAGGIKLSLVVNDAALEVGEKVSITDDQIIGIAYVRENSIASDVLRQLAGANWYVDPAGITQIKAWPKTNITTPFTVIDQDGDQGKITIATENYAAWLPNAEFTAPQLDATYTIGSSTYRFQDDGTARVEVLTQ